MTHTNLLDDRFRLYRYFFSLIELLSKHFQSAYSSGNI